MTLSSITLTQEEGSCMVSVTLLLNSCSADCFLNVNDRLCSG